MVIYVLTSEYNDYDQHGEYFEKAFRDIPTIEEMHSAGFRLTDKEYQWMLEKLSELGYADFHNPESLRWAYKWPVVTRHEI